MKIFRSLGEIPAAFGPSVVAIGNFDGVHAGHRQIMRRAGELARAHGYKPAVLTFDPHPARVLAPDRAPKLLMTIDQRLRNMDVEGIEEVLLLPFSLEFAKLTPEEFVDQVLSRTLNARVVLVGEDFRFGYKQSGNVETLRTLGERFGYELEAVPAIMQRGERISSTAIRKLVEAGRVSRACRMLGAPFALEGSVIQGQGIGSKQTVPTLNLAPLNEVLPRTGVYVTRTLDLDTQRRWTSITNVGYRPTFEGKGLTVETFLLGSLPRGRGSDGRGADGRVSEGESAFTKGEGMHIEVSFLKFVRDERKFEGPEALKAQILKDVGVAKRLHRRLDKIRVG